MRELREGGREDEEVQPLQARSVPVLLCGVSAGKLGSAQGRVQEVKQEQKEGGEKEAGANDENEGKGEQRVCVGSGSIKQQKVSK